MTKHNLGWLALILALLPFGAAAAQTGEGQFGCPGRTRFFANTGLQLAPMDQDGIEQWRARPALAFAGFDEQRYGFHQIALYRWRAPLEGAAQSEADSDSTVSGQEMYRAALAVRLLGDHSDQWFELKPETTRSAASDDLLYMDAADSTKNEESTGEEQVANALAESFSVRPATPDAALPIFLLEFSYGGAEGMVTNHLMLDLRSGKPQISKAVQCIEAQPAGGACDTPDRTIFDVLRCNWDPSNGDFRCSMISPFGSENAVKAASRDFFLLSGRPAAPEWYTADSPPDLGKLAVQLSRKQTGARSSVMVPEFGPATLLAHYKDLLPGTEQFVFASPGAGKRFNAHFSLVTVSPDGQSSVQTIRKSVLSGEKTDESARLQGYTPSPDDDRYHTSALEDRDGFHAFQAVLTAAPSTAFDQLASKPAHVIYWVGVEAVDGKLVANAVRVASDASTAASCAQQAHDGTAISIEPQQGLAAATVHVRPADLPSEAAAQPDEDVEAPSGCVWIGGLYWKPATGFQARRIEDDCEAGVPEVAITEDGHITVKPAQGPVEER